MVQKSTGTEILTVKVSKTQELRILVKGDFLSVKVFIPEVYSCFV